MRVGVLIVLFAVSTSSIGAVPTIPTTAVFTVWIVLAPLVISTVSTPCKKDAGIKPPRGKCNWGKLNCLYILSLESKVYSVLPNSCIFGNKIIFCWY